MPVEVNVEVDYEGATPSAFAVSLRLPAELSEEQRESLVAIARKCPVHNALASATPVTVAHRVESL